MWVYSGYIWEKFQICVAICTYENQRRRRKKKKKGDLDRTLGLCNTFYGLDWIGCGRKEGRQRQDGSYSYSSVSQMPPSFFFTVLSLFPDSCSLSILDSYIPHLPLLISQFFTPLIPVVVLC